MAISSIQNSISGWKLNKERIMKKRLLTPLLAAVFLFPMLAFAGPNITGYLSNSEWTNPGSFASYRNNNNNYTPSGTLVGNYDLEKMGLLITDTQLMFGVSGDYNLKNGINRIDPGDFAFSFNDGASYDLAIDYSIGRDNNVELRFRWGNLQWQDPIYKEHLAYGPWQVSAWDHEQIISSDTSSDHFTSSYQGKYQHVQSRRDYYSGHGIEVAVNLADLDASILRLFDNNAGPNGVDKALLRLTMECGNDMIQTNHQYNVAVVPEPGSFILLGIGLLGLSAIGRRRTLKD